MARKILSTVFVVSFRTLGTGGFDWFPRRSDALRAFEKEKKQVNLTDPDLFFEVRYVGEMQVPFPLSEKDEITHWIDNECETAWDFSPAWVED